MARNRLFEVLPFRPQYGWKVSLLAPDAPDGTPRPALLTGQGGKLLAIDRFHRVPYANWIGGAVGYFIGGWREDIETWAQGEVTRRRATKRGTGPNGLYVVTEARASDLAPGAAPQSFAAEWARLSGRVAIAADHWDPMLRETAGFSTERTDNPMNVTASIGFTASVRLKGTRMAAFTEKDEFGNTYNWTGDHSITGTVSADDGGRALGDQETVALLARPLLLFPNASPGARLRLHFKWSAGLYAAVATGRDEHALSGGGTVLTTRWRPARLTVANPALALFASPKPFNNTDFTLEGNYTAAGTMPIPLALTPAAEEEGKGGSADADGTLTHEVTVPPSRTLLFAWADGFVQSLVDALAADATPYLGDPADGVEERKHREHLHAELSFSLGLTPLLVEEILEETNQKAPGRSRGLGHTFGPDCSQAQDRESCSSPTERHLKCRPMAVPQWWP